MLAEKADALLRFVSVGVNDTIFMNLYKENDLKYFQFFYEFKNDNKTIFRVGVIDLKNKENSGICQTPWTLKI